jgi:hypothetical protein
MRHVLPLASFIFFVVGCAPPPVDHTPNRTAASANDALGYPPPPYGYKEGRTIENIDFTGKMPTDAAAAAATYMTLGMQKISLNDFRINPAVKLIYLIGSARWCVPCNDEQPMAKMLGEMYKPQGVQQFDVLVEGGTVGSPATNLDIDKWGTKFMLNVPIAIDPEFKIQEFADTSAFPLNMLISTKDMKIAWMCVGGQCDAEAAITANLP